MADAARHPPLWTVPALAALALLAIACKGTPGGPASPTAGASPTASGDGTTPTAGASPTVDSPDQKTLRQMVLLEDDLPPGIQMVGQEFTTNEAVIEASPDPEATRAELAKWGRILGYGVDFQPGPDTLPTTPIRGVSVSVSLYETAAGATDSYASAEKQATETDWAAQNPNLTQFQQRRIGLEGVADQILWLRLSGISASPAGVITDDIILIRVDRARAFIRVLTTAPGEDRGTLLDAIKGWVRTEVRRVNDTLAAGGPP